MITSTMNKQEVNREIISVLPELMRIVISKTKFRVQKAQKKGFKDEVSSYDIKGVEFWVYYFKDKGEDVFVVSNVRNPGSIKLRDRLLISKLFFVLQNPTFFSAGFAA